MLGSGWGERKEQRGKMNMNETEGRQMRKREQMRYIKISLHSAVWGQRGREKRRRHKNESKKMERRRSREHTKHTHKNKTKQKQERTKEDRRRDGGEGRGGEREEYLGRENKIK